MENPRKPGILVQIFTLLYLFGMMWYVIPSVKRKLILMGLVDEIRWRSQRMACANGRRGMNQELTGYADAAKASYNLAYALMRGVHDRAVTWYEKTRGTIS